MIGWSGDFDFDQDVAAAVGHDTAPRRWFVEVLLYTGQRMATGVMQRECAITTAQERMSDVAVLVVSMINEKTGQAISVPSHALRASRMGWPTARRRMSDRDLIEEACGPAQRAV